MKICAVVAEYNPFHLGHALHLNYIKTVLGFDKIIVFMSGNFTQRGEPALLNKFTRAKHAVIAGADMVIELPSVFAVGNAETFATGAVRLIDNLNVCDGLCFGVESGDKQSFLSLATALTNESKEFKKILKTHLDKGVSLAKAKFLTVKELGGNYDESLISTPNNILGLEYAKALVKTNSAIQIFPMVRSGDHNDKQLKKGVTSATSIREQLKLGKIKAVKKNLPPFVYSDLKEYPFGFDNIIMSRVLTQPEEYLKKLPDCTEGLENRIKALSKDNLTLEGLIQKVTTKRYTSSRIRRILISNLLGVTEELKNQCLTNGVYAKVLAVNSESKDLITMLANKSNIPVLTRKSDEIKLKKQALKAFYVDTLAIQLYNLVTGEKQNEHYMFIV